MVCYEILHPEFVEKSAPKNKKNKTKKKKTTHIFFFVELRNFKYAILK